MEPAADWFADLYRRRYRPLVMMALATAGSLAEAEEAVQEAFERGYARRARLEMMANPEAWLYTVAVNELRRRHRRRSLFGRLRLGTAQSAPPWSDSAADAVDLYRALGELPPVWREVLVLHHLADLPVGEIATRLSVPVGTVKSRLARGREALAQRVALLDPPVLHPPVLHPATLNPATLKTEGPHRDSEEVERHG